MKNKRLVIRPVLQMSLEKEIKRWPRRALNGSFSRGDHKTMVFRRFKHQKLREAASLLSAATESFLSAINKPNWLSNHNLWILGTFKMSSGIWHLVSFIIIIVFKKCYVVLCYVIICYIIIFINFMLFSYLICMPSISPPNYPGQLTIQ